MADNKARYGFRWFSGRDGRRTMPTPEVMIVATAQSFDVNGGAANVNLGAGDPVIKLSTGGVTLCDGAEGAGGQLIPYGVCVGVMPYWNAAAGRMTPSNVLPSDVAWGTLLERQSKVLVVPFGAGIWEIDCDDATTATTEAAYQAFIGENSDWRLTGASGQTRAFPKFDISAHNTTNTLVLRIKAISPTMENRDFSGANVKLLVEPNLWQTGESNATGV